MLHTSSSYIFTLHAYDVNKTLRHLYPLDPADQTMSQCWSCMKFMEGVSEAIFKWQRCLSHFDYYMIMREYRIGEHNFPFEEDFFDELDSLTEDNLHELYRIAALQYPKFLNLLISENYLLSISGTQRSKEVPEYDFKFVLPSSEEKWPFLEIHD
ncbi:hypothetical protein WUBG_06375 [Wuchereria bancrofti]|uniref:Uncharacterized protein n=1 Tax=Wuchereria bancrofti TaxID=6293 RepID=J9EZT2_WUCBA|nr:hypothetical protein WUBG_06375 [Wuchereria bancrofti]